MYQRKRLRKTPPVADSKLNQQLEQLNFQSDDKIKSEKFGKCLGPKSTKGILKARNKKCENSSMVESVGASVMRIDKIKRKTEVCKRHVPQLLIRGEHVASVVLM